MFVIGTLANGQHRLWLICDHPSASRLQISKRVASFGIEGGAVLLDTFWSSQVKLSRTVAVLQSGVLIRGNLRAERSEVFNALCAKVKELFGGKYEVLMVEDPEAADDDTPAPPPRSKAGDKAIASAQEPRVAFQVTHPTAVGP